MTRYVNKKHGVVIGSGNNFFYKDLGGKFHDFPCILSLKSYYFDQYYGCNTDICTPAQQLVFQPIKMTVKSSWRGINLDHDVTRYVPSQFTIDWCKQHDPNFGSRPPKEEFTSEFMLFFTKRKKALAFYYHIDHILSGIKIGEF